MINDPMILNSVVILSFPRLSRSLPRPVSCPSRPLSLGRPSLSQGVSGCTSPGISPSPPAMVTSEFDRLKHGRVGSPTSDHAKGPEDPPSRHLARAVYSWPVNLSTMLPGEGWLRKSDVTNRRSP
ncbi:hypothetical protein BO71DRAFT_147745 [Aspergillus ellipticus CBS 707.79]|uniref:Uncharacterized protein n=1 Tax=Aspergillus ellipticus CBS 707.79 TaxID=1448320 RepID=A0A319EAN9_9EURO|nr:hypothetical protein BO71DRAFT_147745 [Aspergillus ellipticus CBS 707.79]